MVLIIHLLTGIFLYNTITVFYKKFKSIKNLLLIIVCSILPCFDYLIKYIDKTFFYKYYLNIFHSIFVIIIISFIILYVFRLKFKPYFYLILSVFLIHIFMDLLSLNGTTFLFPVYTKIIRLDLLSEFDVFVLNIFLVSNLLLYIFKDRFKQKFIIFFAVFLFVSYCICSMYIKKKIYNETQYIIQNSIEQKQIVNIIPAQFYITQKYIILEDKNNYYLARNSERFIAQRFKKFNIKNFNNRFDSEINKIVKYYTKNLRYPVYTENQAFMSEQNIVLFDLIDYNWYFGKSFKRLIIKKFNNDYVLRFE